jgi:phospholipid N-methyltransferase
MSQSMQTIHTPSPSLNGAPMPSTNGIPAPSKNGTATPSANGSPRTSRSPDWLLMLGKFLRHGSTIASFVPSSRFLCKALIRGIDWDRAQCIVELGAGTGPVTRQMVKRAKPHTRLIVIEQDPDFCRRLREKFHAYPKLDVVEGDACKLDQILAERGITMCDHVLCGLPTPSIPGPAREAIMAAAQKVLPPEGLFRQLTNMPWIFWRFYKNYFEHVRFKLVPLNFPPAGVYYCRGYKGPKPMS